MSLFRSGSSVSRFHGLGSLACLCLAALASRPAEAQLVAAIRNYDKSDIATITALPKLLSQTGLYTNIANKATRAISDTNSIVYFEVNSALWSDGSHKQRFISVPAGSRVTPTDTSKFTFPDNTVLIKNFAIDTVYGDSNSRIFVETRFLVYQSTASAKKWSGISYKWRRNQTDAELVDLDFGLDTTLNVRLNGTLVGKRWRYPSMEDCAQCHLGEEGAKRGTLGFITPQLNRMMAGTNQLQRLVAKNVLTVNPLTAKPNLHRWYGSTETGSVTLEQKARSYLAANCSHCHGNGTTFTQASHNFDYMTATKKINYSEDPVGGWVGKKPESADTLIYPAIVLPGKPDSSFLMRKIMTRTDDFIPGGFPEQMPVIATSQVDSTAIKLMRDWICSLKAGTTTCKTYDWLPDDVNWGDPAPPDPNGVGIAHIRRNRTAQVRLNAGMLTLPPAMAASRTVELRDSHGRSIPLQPVGNQQYRLPADMRAGAYLLRAGTQSMLLHYLP